MDRPAPAAPPSSESLPASQVGPFSLLQPLGEGGMAEVWRASYAVDDQPVAMKFLTRLQALGSEAVSAFRNEVRTIAGLCHPNLITIHELGQLEQTQALPTGRTLPPQTPYLVLELMAGGTLEQHRARLTWPLLRASLEVLLGALGHAHARGVLHLDLKPANVLFGQAGNPQTLKLTDFGIARVQGKQELTDVTGTRQRLAHELRGLNDVVLGTPEYMAPEQLLGSWRDQGPWTDLYALGIMTYQLVTGALPFSGSSPLELMKAHCHQLPPPLCPALAIPADLEGWLQRLLAKDPAQRFQRASDAAWALSLLEERLIDPVGLRSPLSTGPAPETVMTSHSAFNQATRRLSGPPVPTGSAGRSPVGGDEETRARPPSASSLLPPSLPPILPPPLPGTWRGAADSVPLRVPRGLGLSLFGLRTIPLVGRERARNQLWQALLKAGATRQPHAVFLRGTTGIGKSRLAEWLTERAHELGAATVLVAAHGPGHSDGDGLAGMLVQTLNLQELSDPEARARLQKHLQRLGLTSEHLEGPLLEVARPALPSARTGGAGRSCPLPERHNALRRLLTALSATRPLILWLDDVHYGLESLQLVKTLLQPGHQALELPLLILLTAPEEGLHQRLLEASELQELEKLPAVQALILEPLSQEERSTLLQKELGLDPVCAAGVEARAGGNPLFMLQLVGDWVARKILIPTTHGFGLRPGASLPVPESIHALWLNRLAQVGAFPGSPSLLALELAALLGSPFEVQEWTLACQKLGLPLQEEALRTLVEQLLDLHLLERDNRLLLASPSGLVQQAHPQWRFTHGLCRESLEKSALESGRHSSLHRACADALEALYGAGVSTSARRRAHHRLAAGQKEAGLEPLIQSIRFDFQRGLLESALAQGQTCGKLLDELELPQDDPRRCELLTIQCHLLINIQRAGEAEALLNQLRKGLEHRRWEPWYDTILRLHGDYCRYRGDCTAARTWYERALKLAHTQADQLELGSVYRGLANVAWSAGQLQETERLYQQAIRCFRRADNPPGLAAAYSFLGLVGTERGDFSQARACLAEALHIAEEHGLQGTQVEIYRGMALLQQQQGKLSEARDTLQQARDRLVRLGSYYTLPDFINQQGMLELADHKLEEAAGYFQEALMLCAKAGAGASLAQRFNLIIVRLKQGNVVEARKLLDGQLTRIQQTGNLRYESAFLIAELWCSVLRERPSEAHHLATRLEGLPPERLDREDRAYLAELEALVRPGDALLADQLRRCRERPGG